MSQGGQKAFADIAATTPWRCSWLSNTLCEAALSISGRASSRQLPGWGAFTGSRRGLLLDRSHIQDRPGMAIS